MWPSTIMLTIILLLLPSSILCFPSVTSTNNVSWSSIFNPKHAKFRKQGSKRCISPLEKLQIFLFRGDPIIWFWALIMLVIPIAVILLVVSQKDISNTNGLKLWIHRLANPAGYCATIALSLFMVPVAKQSPLLAAIRWSPVQALGFHVWAGRVCFFMTFLHGTLYVLDYGLKGKFSFWPNVITGMIPHGKCWSFQSIWAFQSGSHCYQIWRNATGLVSGLSLLLLVTTSLNYIRRRNYRFFYVSHIICSSVMLIFAIFHFYWIAIYLVPGLIYYLACSLPIVVQQLAVFFIDGGTMLKECKVLASSNGCMELTFAKFILRGDEVQSPAYVRICVPELSMMWHPFTVPHIGDGRVNELKLLIRRSGYFTSALHKRLRQSSKPPPTILVDGFYQGSDWLSHAVKHDAVLMVSGGIGVTPMLPLLQLLFKQSKSSIPQRTQLVCFHWFCRDEGLIRHVVIEYMKTILNDLEPTIGFAAEDVAPSCHFQIIIHFTGREVDDPEPFPISIVEDNDDAPLVTEDVNDGKGTILSNEESFHDEPDFLSPATPPGVRKRISSDDPPNDITNNYHKSKSNKGIAIEAASFSQFGGSRLITFVGLSAFIVAYVIYLYWYMTEVREHRERIFFRGYSMYAIIIFLVGAALIMEYCRRKCKRYYVARDPDVCNPKEECVLETKALLHCQQLPCVGRFGSDISIHFDVINGRPLLNDVVHSIVEAEVPGAFYCGPHDLMKTVQKKIETERRRVRGCMAARCCNYQEHFEM